MCIRNIVNRHDMKTDANLDALDEAVEYVESIRISGGKVLSHCWYGKNRRYVILSTLGASPVAASSCIFIAGAGMVIYSAKGCYLYRCMMLISGIHASTLS